ncbi:hypothetical protein IW261DRAFT_1623911 [Armillaria novae-zelandiae]|uniref:Uncharacterized protein n=1 Tax=Armillaria novae-zelandiae TaxID=153914 RepID=A0AA39PA20_9AGAR|nr:hypothetical protein IW261DRAFT_1623911 [Armillaria novae-zelandiae]
MSTVPTGQPIKLPTFDNSLGALYIGSSLATVLYGVICVQTFLYITSNRTRFDSWAMKLLVFILFSKTHLNRSGLDTVQQCLMLAGMYRFLITDYANPVALSTEGSSSGLALASYDEAIVAKHPTWFFCWRVWTLSASSLNLYIRIAIIAISVALACLNFGLSIFGFRHHFFAVNSLDFTSLPLAITGNEKYLVLPNATIYGGVYLLLSKSYLNSFLAILNSRDFLREKMDHSQPGQLSVPDFAGPSTSDGTSAPGEEIGLSLTSAIGSSTSKA